MGYNLQDHYGTGALTFTIDQPVSLVQTRYENIPAVLKYAIFGSGPLTVLGGVEVRDFFYQIIGGLTNPAVDNESSEGLKLVQSEPVGMVEGFPIFVINIIRKS